MAPDLRSPSIETASRVLAVIAVLSASVAAIYLLLPDPLADAFFAGWVLVSVGLALVGGIGAWTNRTPLVWVAALVLTGLAIVGMWSIGLFIAPATVFLFGAALLSQLAGPRTDVQKAIGEKSIAEEAIVVDPPTVREAVLKTLAGVGSVVVGGWLVYAAAVARELFGACARETVACAIDKTHWDAVGMAALGLIGISLGGWLLWKQAYIARVLASTGTE